MTRRRSAKRAHSWVALALGLLVQAFPASAATISIQPPSTTVAAGSPFTVDIAIENVSDLFAFQFDLAFNQAVVSATGIVEGPFLPGAGATAFVSGVIDNTTGLISVTADTLTGPVAGASGMGVLATASFVALAGGVSPLDLSGVILLDSALNDVAVDVAGGSVTVTGPSAPVSEPPTVFLVLMSLLACSLVRRIHSTRRGYIVTALEPAPRRFRAEV